MGRYPCHTVWDAWSTKMKRRDQQLGMATHPRSLRAKLIVFEPVVGICLPRRPSRSLSRVNYGNSDDGDHNLARDGRSALACVTEHVERFPKETSQACRGVKWVSAANLPPAVPAFLGPTYFFCRSVMAHRKAPLRSREWQAQLPRR